mgnify:CR=1 FL=1
MTRLSRHVSVTVLAAMLMVQLLLLGLDLVFSFIGELDNVKGNYGAWQAFQHVVLILPSHVYEILPMSALIGALVGLSMLTGLLGLIVLLIMTFACWAYAFAVVFMRTRAIVLEREAHTDWVKALREDVP